MIEGRVLAISTSSSQASTLLRFRLQSGTELFDGAHSAGRSRFSAVTASIHTRVGTYVPARSANLQYDVGGCPTVSTGLNMYVGFMDAETPTRAGGGGLEVPSRTLISEGPLACIPPITLGREIYPILEHICTGLPLGSMVGTVRA